MSEKEGVRGFSVVDIKYSKRNAKKEKDVKSIRVKRKD